MNDNINLDKDCSKSKFECLENDDLLMTIMNSDAKVMNNLIELKVMNDVIKTNSQVLQSKYMEIREEEHKLDMLQAEVWKLQDEICNEIFSFSNNHDFAFLAKHIPNINTECLIDCFNSEYENHRKILVSKVLQHPEIYNLTIKIEQLENEIKNMETENELKRQIKDATVELANLSQDDAETLFLKKEIERAQRDVKIINKKIEAIGFAMNHNTIENNSNISTRNNESPIDINCMELFLNNYSKKPTTTSSNIQNKIAKENNLCNNMDSTDINLEIDETKTNIINSERLNSIKSEQQNVSTIFLKKQNSNKHMSFRKNPNICIDSNAKFIPNDNLDSASVKELFSDEFPILEYTNGKTPSAFVTAKTLLQSKCFEKKKKCVSTQRKRVKFDLTPTAKLPTFDNEKIKSTGFTVKKPSKISRKFQHQCK